MKALQMIGTLAVTGSLLGAWADQPLDETAWARPAPPSIPARTVTLTDFGAVPDGHTLNTAAFARAIDAVAAQGGGRVVVPPGLWRTGPIVLQSRLDLHLEEGAVILFSDNRADYPLVETSYEGRGGWRCQSPLSGVNLEHVAITGHGILDGAGQAWRPVKKSKLTERQWSDLVASGGAVNERGDIWYPSLSSLAGNTDAGLRGNRDREALELIRDALRPVMLKLVNCRNILLEGVTFQNSPAWCLHPLMCTDLTVRDITVRNPWYSQNGDGLDIESCRDVLVEGCSFDVGDDAICLKSGRDAEGRRRGKPVQNVRIRDCVVYHGHGGFVVGSEMSGGVRNIHVSDCTFIGTDVGLRFKSTRGRGGVVEDILVERIRMFDIPTEAIRFNLFYGGAAPIDDSPGSGEGEAIPPVTEETPVFRDIVLRDIVCRGARRAALLSGLPEQPLENIRLEGIRVSADKGLLATEVAHLTLSGLDLQVKEAPALEFRDVSNVELHNCGIEGGAGPAARVSGARTESVHLQGLSGRRDAVVIAPGVPEGAVRLD